MILTGHWFALFFATFALEDAALAAAILLVAEEQVSVASSFTACFSGIVIGDLGLYGLGLAFKKIDFIHQFEFLSRHLKGVTPKKLKSLDLLIFTSRAIPGTRLPTYLACGFLGYSFTRFFLFTFLSVGIWVSIVFFGAASLVTMFSENRLLSIALMIACFTFLRRFLPKLFGHWERKALLSSWRKWLHFEFWPAWLFYLPIIPYYAQLALRQRNLFLPFYANPQILNGGLIGESKWDFLKHLDLFSPHTLKSILITSKSDVLNTRDEILQSGITFPFVLKPDVGQRGYGVRIIRSENELSTELNLRAGSSTIAQTLSRFEKEAGVFYMRYPSQTRGFLFSITDKEFPFVVGDGRTKLGDLILGDKRARVIASVYFSRLSQMLDTVIPKGQLIPLAECGNHCQGAIFKNGNRFITEALLDKIEIIAKTVPDFYFGRFDIRYENAELLMQGLHFEIVEINGASSEATHIWDSRTRITEAYAVLFQQWSHLFKIGHEVKRSYSNRANIKVWALLKECVRVFRRSDELSTSS